MLYSEFMEPFVRYAEYSESDGEGGRRTSESASPSFMCAAVPDSLGDGQVAASDRMIRAYTLTAPKGTGLFFFETVKRVSDGQRFRVVSVPSDRTTPDRATFAFEQVKAEAVYGKAEAVHE